MKKYVEVNVSSLCNLKELQEENRRLKQMYAELNLDHKILKNIVEKKVVEPRELSSSRVSYHVYFYLQILK